MSVLVRYVPVAVLMLCAACGGDDVSPIDAGPGPRDSGLPDVPSLDGAGQPDAGVPDGGSTTDAGTPPPPLGDRVDVLLVIDNSNSMAEEQNNLAANLPVLLQILVTGDVDGDGTAEYRPASDIHAGVVTTDMGTAPGHALPTCDDGLGDDGQLVTRGNTSEPGCMAAYPRFLSFAPGSGVPESFARDLACVAVQGVGGCGFEQPLEAALKAVTPSVHGLEPFLRGTGHADGVNAGFRRADALLALLFLTDEEDCSVRDPEVFSADSTRYPGELNLRCFQYGDQVAWPLARYVTGFDEAAGAADRVIVGIIAGVPPELVPADGALDCDAVLAAPAMQERLDPMLPGRLVPSCNQPGLGIAFPPRRLVQIACSFGPQSTVQSICVPDLRPAMTAIARRIAERLGRR